MFHVSASSISVRCATQFFFHLKQGLLRYTCARMHCMAVNHVRHNVSVAMDVQVASDGAVFCSVNFAIILIVHFDVECKRFFFVMVSHHLSMRLMCVLEI